MATLIDENMDSSEDFLSLIEQWDAVLIASEEEGKEEEKEIVLDGPFWEQVLSEYYEV